MSGLAYTWLVVDLVSIKTVILHSKSKADPARNYPISKNGGCCLYLDISGNFQNMSQLYKIWVRTWFTFQQDICLGNKFKQTLVLNCCLKHSLKIIFRLTGGKLEKFKHKWWTKILKIHMTGAMTNSMKGVLRLEKEKLFLLT